MCNKSSCTQCHSKSHCQEFAKNKQIAKLLRTIEHLDRRLLEDNLENNEVIDELTQQVEGLKEQLEKYGKMIVEADERIEKMKNCDNCKHVDFDYDGTSCKLYWDKNENQKCSRFLTCVKDLPDLWELV